MERINAKFLQARFETLAKARGWTHQGSAWQRVGEKNVATIGHTSIEHNTYAGWKIVRIVNEGGGEHVIARADTAREMCAWMGGTLYVAYDSDKR